MKIGDKIRALRQEKKMSLSQLSEQSGVALATLSRIEHKKMVGTLESHLKIAKALGINISLLYSEAAAEPKKSAQPIQNTERDVFVHNDKSAFEILTNQIFAKKMMPVLMKLEAGGNTAREQAGVPTEKFVYVLEGAVDLDINNIKYSLKKGESLYFDGALPHYFKNSGKAQSRLLCVTTPPTL
jgi:transcriptional regulator with XRE-family HTH domain